MGNEVDAIGAIPIARVAHCNVNCSSLPRSLAFYRDVVGLVPTTHTAPAPQPAGGFPLPPGTTEVQWDAWLLHPAGVGRDAPDLDLLEWVVPPPTGQPAPTAADLGLNRVRYLVGDVAATHERFVAGGGTAFAPPAPLVIDLERDDAVLGFAGTDPDGIVLEFVAGGMPATRPAHLGVNCSDLDASVRWYTRVLGLEVIARGTSGAQPGALYGLQGECSWRSALLRLPGTAPESFGLELREWELPRIATPPYPTANHLGIYRLAFIVDDIRAAASALHAHGVAGGAPVALDMGPDVPITGKLWASFFADPDGTCLEFIEQVP